MPHYQKWNEEVVKDELKEVIDDIGHFPTDTELRLINRKDLNSAIYRLGGFPIFRQSMGYNYLHKPKGYWSDKTIITELKKIINQLGHFPSRNELTRLGKNILSSAIHDHGGINKFRILIGYKLIKKPNNYWNNDIITNELKVITNNIGHFPTQKELVEIKRYDLLGGINSCGGINYFKQLLGYKIVMKPANYWSNDKIIEELEVIIKNIGYFPSMKDLISIRKSNLSVAISKHGGFIKFRKLFGYNLLKKRNYWNDKTIIEELNIIIKKTGRFPTQNELIYLERRDLERTISSHGGINKFRSLMKYDLLKAPNGYWTDENIIKDLKEICNKLGHFPTHNEIITIKKDSLYTAISINGGLNRFRELCGYSISIYKKYISELRSYCIRRGKSTENLIKQILIEYCILHNLPSPSYNIKLVKGNIIEFICNGRMKIGIDVTNAKDKHTITKKWKYKSYHSYLDELWIVVFSDVFKDSDYSKWNSESPKNIKILSVYTFLSELDYSLSENMKNKIDKYCSCTFHTKEELKEMK